MIKNNKPQIIALCVLAAAMAAGLGAAAGKSGNLGLISALVPVSAVALAFITREVVASLCVSLFYGCMLLGANAPERAGPVAFLSGTLKESVEAVLLTLTDPGSAAVVVMCLVLGGLVAVINRAGAFQSVAAFIIRRIKSPRQAVLAGELMGVAVFFDDYANSLIVGPVMRPVTDKLGVSREKLAYVVDSTAAPVSSIALLSSWVGTEVAAIQAGLDAAGVEAFAYRIFLSGIPYNFYNILTLAFIAIGALFGREYGPMLRAEERARAGLPLKPGSMWKASETTVENEGQKPANMLVAILPILTLCALTFAGFYTEGRRTAVSEGLLAPDAVFSLETLMTAFGSADTVFIILEVSVAVSVFAILLGVGSKAFSFIEGVVAWEEGASGLLVTVSILVLSWSLAGVVDELGLVSYLVDIITAHVAYWLVPSLIFATCCLSSFGIGSYGCMAIVTPMVVPIACEVVALTPGVADGGQFIACCVACVLSGSVFGDHCSPITDTTILSSIGAGCDNLDHARTQLPYAVTTAIIATLCGSLPAGFGVSFWVSYPIGLAMIAATFLLFGKKPEINY